MGFVLGILIIICLTGMQIAPRHTWMHDYMSISKTTAIKGLFVILVLLSHFSQYVELNNVYDKPYVLMQRYLSQMIVVMFLFYSGYGMMEAIRRKKYNYIQTIFSHRFLKVLTQFNLALLLFLAMQLCLGKHYSLKHLLLSSIGYASIGNSNWYIFVTLVLYIFVFMAFYGLKYAPNQKMLYKGTLGLTILTIAYMVLMIYLKRPTRFYNTIIVFPFGMWFSLMKERVDALLMQQKNNYLIGLGLSLICYLVVSFYRKDYGIVSYSLWSLMFTWMIILISMKVSIENSILNWFGTHVFSVYILQRIPMILLSKMGLNQTNPWLFFILVIIFSILLADVFDRVTRRVNIGTYFSKNC